MLERTTNRTKETKNNVMNVFRMRKFARIVMRVIAGTALTALLVIASSFETRGNVGTDGNIIDDVQVVEAGILPKIRTGHKVRDDEGKVIDDGGRLSDDEDVVILEERQMQIGELDEAPGATLFDDSSAPVQRKKKVLRKKKKRILRRK